MKTLDDLPVEVVQSIIFSIRRPVDHLAFLSSCPTVYKAYTNTVCRALCAGYAIGRPISMKDESWIKIFYKVMAHAKDCSVLGCDHFNAPIPDKTWLPTNRFNPAASFPSKTEKRSVHLHLVRLGDTTLDNFLGSMLRPIRSQFERHGPITWSPFSESARFWPKGNRENGEENQPPPMCQLKDHPVIATSFCCEPPIQAVKVNMQVLDNSLYHALHIPVYNEDGITVIDVVESVQKWFETPMTDKDRILAYKRMSDDNEEFDHERGCDNNKRMECSCATYGTYEEFLDFWLNITPGEALKIQGIVGANVDDDTKADECFSLWIVSALCEFLILA